MTLSLSVPDCLPQPQHLQLLHLPQLLHFHLHFLLDLLVARAMRLISHYD